MTPDLLKMRLSSLISDSNDALPCLDQMGEIRQAAKQMGHRDRSELFEDLHQLMVSLANIKAALGTGSCDLLGCNADPASIMNLLCAIKPHRLSDAVIGGLASGAIPRLGGTAALPPAIHDLICDRLSQMAEGSEGSVVEAGDRAQGQHTTQH